MKTIDPEILQKALLRIASYPGESIWMDARDDAANDMVRIAEKALEGIYEEPEPDEE